MPTIEAGSIWREKETGRRIKILEEEVHGTGPAWTYIGGDGEPEPHGYEPANGFTYGDWFWHYCDVMDFVLWGRFEKLS